jgi:hypothetical protein
MNKEKAYSYVNQYFGPVNPSTNGWVDGGTCPFCGKKKLAYQPDYLIVKCWAGCFKGFLTDLIKIYQNISYFETRELIDSMEPGLTRLPHSVTKTKAIELILPIGYTPILSGETLLGIRARTYLTKRGFDLNYMDRLGVGYCIDEDKDPRMNFFGRIIIPFKRHGILSYYIGRTFINAYDRYKNPPTQQFGIGKADVLFNEEALLLEDSVFMTEGWSDSCTLGSNAISIQGSTPSTIQKNIIIKSSIKEIVIVPDAEFYIQGLQTARDFINYKKVKVLNLDPFKKQGLGKDANEIGKEKILELSNDTPYLTMGTLYKEIREYEKSFGSR